MNNLVSEIRTKLHIKTSNEPEVKNLWMCLDYDQKPTIAHVIDHVQKNLLEKKTDISECKLYLDNYWLPPYENSRLIRENDCIKVQVNYNEPSEAKSDASTVQVASTDEKLTELNQNVLKHIKATEEKRLTEKQMELERSAQKGLTPAEIATVEAATRQTSDYYNHYYDTRNSYYGAQTAEQNMNAYNYWLNNDYFKDQMMRETIPVQTETKTSKNMTKATQKQQQQPSKNITKSSPKPQEGSVNSYRKFAIGSYAHLLNEPVQPPKASKANKKSGKAQNKQFEDVPESDHLSEEQVIDTYYNAIQKKTTKNQKINENSEFDKIAANVNSAGNKKWRNSTQPAKQNGPKHIIFRTSSSEDSSSSECEDDKLPVKPVKVAATSPAKKISLESKTVNKFYEPSKQEQIDSVSYNRSYFIKNTKNVIDFKKTFNEEKLNAPQSEEFADRSTYPSKKATKNLNTTTESTCSESTSPTKRTQKAKSPSKINKIDYGSFQNLVGAPRIDDKIAFQILEISANFTPEVSDYKTGKVIEFNEASNEITLELYNKYNQVLKKSNKFSVILDETDKELDEEIVESRPSQSNENILKVDWRNLMNLKLIPSEKVLTKQQELNMESSNLMVHV